MKLAVSNIAWYNGYINEFTQFIADLGCSGIELAPSMVWSDPTKSSRKERAELRNSLIDTELDLTGFQALFFNRQDLILFGDEKRRNAMLIFLTELMDLCNDLEGEVLVFGSPRNRNMGKLPKEKALPIALDFFREIGKQAEERNVFVCIEPLGRRETDFINTVAEAQQFIEEVGNPNGLGLHIDIKELIEENEINELYLEDSFTHAKHIHISENDLVCPGSTGFDHTIISKRIKASGYSRFGSIEMRRVEGNVEGSIKQAVDYVKRCYF
jgi:sugar phosphate isomerase/epimerase